MFKRLKTAILRRDKIEFLCNSEDVGVIPVPVPARKILPDWFKNLPPKIDNKLLQNSSIKRCMPFLDALSLGWIIPLAADVEFTCKPDGSINTKSLFYRTMVETHNHQQVAGHPMLPQQPWKWLNWWAIRVPKDYSLLFVPPLNRYEPRFQCVSGMVDDTYMGRGALEFINFPFFFTQPNYSGIVKQGTPLVQVIPIKRSTLLEMNVDSLQKADHDLIDHTRRRRNAHESLYRDSLRQPK